MVLELRHWYVFGYFQLCKEGGVERPFEQLHVSKAVHLLDSDSILPLNLDTRQLGIDNATNVADFGRVQSMIVGIVAIKVLAAPHQHVGFDISLHISLVLSRAVTAVSAR